MALAKIELEQQLQTNGQVKVLAEQPVLLEAAPVANIAHYDPNVQIKGNGIRGWFRASRIIWTFALYHLFVFAYHRGWFIGKKDESEEKHLQWQGEWLSCQLLKLGPTFIKIGQSISTRADLLPLAYIKELSKLQDNVPAFPNEVAMQIIERELGKPIDALFAEIGPEPIAAASLGQVYRGRLHSGETVAIKVQRPDLEKTINFDIAVLRQIAQFMMRFPQVIRGIDWEGILGEFANVIFEEMDYVQEGQNAETFRGNFRKWREVYVPTIYWSHSSPRVLTMEFIGGLKVLELQALLERGVDPPDVIKLIAKTYLKQLLEDGFFHADPHPGNLRVMDDGRLAFFDFGMVGRITPALQSQLIDAFFHIVEKDVKGLTQDLINLQFLAPTIDQEVIKPVVEKLFTDYFNLKLGEIRFKELTYELAEVIYEYPFRIPSHFTYVMRAIMTLEGIGIAMDPNFNFFDVAKPFAKEFMIRREGKTFRDLIVRKLIYGEEGDIQWGKMWKLAKIAIKSYWDEFVTKASGAMG